MCQRTFGNRRSDAHARVQRRKRVLEHHLDARGALAAASHDRHARDMRRSGCRRQDAGDDAAERRLPATGFAHKPEDLARIDRQRHAVERVNRPRLDRAAERCSDLFPERQARRELLRDVLDLDKRAHRDSAASGWWQRKARVPWRSISGIRRHRSVLSLQRGRNEQPSGSLNSDGVVPGICAKVTPRLGARGQRFKEATTVRMARRAQHRRRRTLLDDAARVHHEDAARERRDGREIVADPDQRHPEIAHQAAHLGEDLRLNRNIKRRGRLVAHDQRRLVQQRNRDRDALAHAAGELVRIGIEPLCGIGNAHSGERLDRPRARGFARDAAMRLQREAHLCRDRQHRIKHAHWVLKHHRDALAAQRTQLLWRKTDQFLPGELHRTADDAAGRIDQSEDGKPRDALARARLADQPDDLASRHIERDAVNRLHDARAREEMSLEVADLEQAHRLSLGLS